MKNSVYLFLNCLDNICLDGDEKLRDDCRKKILESYLHKKMNQIDKDKQNQSEKYFMQADNHMIKKFNNIHYKILWFLLMVFFGVIATFLLNVFWIKFICLLVSIYFFRKLFYLFYDYFSMVSKIDNVLERELI